MRVYPRVRGGTGGCVQCGSGKEGLSPRARGNPFNSSKSRKVLRSIPACAGEPGLKPFPSYKNRVYPRVRGGTHKPRGNHHRDQGLSPRARGNLLLDVSRPMKARSIPACAGEPSKES